MNLKCEKCKRQFASPISIMGASMTMQAGMNATCPNCGHINYIAPSTLEFDSKGDIIKAFLLNKEIPEEDLFRFIEVVKAYKEKNDTNVNAFKSDAAAINPKFIQILDKYKITPDTIIQFFMLLLLAYATFIKGEPINGTIVNNSSKTTNVYPIESNKQTLKNKKTNFQPKKKKRRRKSKY